MAEYIEVDVFLSGGQTVRIKCEEFGVTWGEDGKCCKWDASGATRRFWFSPVDIIGYKVVK